MASTEAPSMAAFDALLRQLRECHVRQVLQLESQLGLDVDRVGSGQHDEALEVSCTRPPSASNQHGEHECIEKDDEDDSDENDSPGNLTVEDLEVFLDHRISESFISRRETVEQAAVKMETEELSLVSSCAAEDTEPHTSSAGGRGMKRMLRSLTDKPAEDSMLFASALDKLNQQSDVPRPRRCSVCPGYDPLRKIVQSWCFEFIFGMLIILNTIIFGLEAQVHGWDTGVAYGYLLHTDSRTAGDQEPWSTILSASEGLEAVIGFAFAVEVILKVAGLGSKQFIKDMWNLLDSAIVAAWAIHVFVSVMDIGGAAVFSSLRVLRAFRVLRLLKTVGLFDSLYLLHAALKGSIGILTWSLLYLFVVQITLALVVSQYIKEFYLNCENVPHSQRVEVYQYFGTFSYATLTMFEMTMANWPPVCRVMMLYVSEWWVVFALAHKLIVGFAVVGIINGVVMQETFKAAAQDKDVMVRDKRKAVDKVRRRLRTVFACADEHKDGRLTVEQFGRLCANPVLKLWLASIGLNTADATKVFNLLDDGDGFLTADELIHGVERFRGFASSLDLHITIRDLLSKFNQISAVQGQKLSLLQRQISIQSAFVKELSHGLHSEAMESDMGAASTAAADSQQPPASALLAGAPRRSTSRVCTVAFDDESEMFVADV
mmetsp:Transcript_6693/g.14671  ORF Transcript_6693/g.14671 Transcript_6693/m.14671 type:complete len:660 (-) Transcript_6693:20-1999(-)